MISALLLILLSSVPSDRYAYTYVCEVSCFSKVISSKPIDCVGVQSNVLSLLSAYDKAGPVSAQQACDSWSDTVVRIREEPKTWYSESGTLVTGMYFWDHALIEVARDMQALAHETLHLYDHMQHNHEGQEAHTGWEKNAVYIQLMNLYSAVAWDLDNLPAVGTISEAKATDQPRAFKTYQVR